MLGASGVQIPQNNLDNLQSIREEDGTLEIVDPPDYVGSEVLEILDSIILDFLLEPTVFVAMALGWHLDDMHVNWAHLEKKRTRLRLYAKSLEELCKKCIETTSRILSDGVRTFKMMSLKIWRRLQIFYDHVDYTTQMAIDYAAGGRLRKLRAEVAWETIDNLAQYEGEWWNDPIFHNKGSPDYIDANLEQELKSMKYRVESLMRNEVVLYYEEGFTFPKRPYQEDFEGRILKLIDDQKYQIRQLKEDMRKTKDTFMCLADSLIANMKVKIEAQRAHSIKIKKITKFPTHTPTVTPEILKPIMVHRVSMISNIKPTIYRTPHQHLSSNLKMPILHSFEEIKLECEDKDEDEIEMIGTGIDRESSEHNLDKNDLTPTICHNFSLTLNLPIKPENSGSFRIKVVEPLTIHTPPPSHVAYFHQNGVYRDYHPHLMQYFQVQDYALWDVIENGNSFKPVAQTTTNAKGTSTTLISGPVTADEKTQKKNDVKARSMLLMVLLNEHLLTFNQYKDANTLFAAIQTRFGGNDATKKTQKTLLQQMYENFKDLNLKILRSLPSEWNTHVVVWRNKPDLDTMSFDDLYNNFKIVEQEVKGTANSSSSSSSQNMAFVSSPSSTNEVNTAYGVSTDNIQVNTASTQVNTTSTQVSTANLSDATVYAFLANQPNGSQLVHEDLEQIHEDDLEEIDLKWQLALLSMRTRKFFQKTGRKITINGSDTAGYDKSKVECFNCHKLGHFARECRGLRNQDNRSRNQDSSRRTINVEEISSKAMLAIDGAGFDWCFMADKEVPTDMALMAFSDSEEFQQPEFDGYGPKTSKSVSEDISNEIVKSPNAPLVEELVLDDKLKKKTVFPTANCNYHQRERVVSGSNYTRVNYNYSAKKAHPNAHRNMVPRAVLMKTGLRTLNTARPVNNVHPKTTIYSARPMSHFSKSAQSTIKRPYQMRTTLTNKSFSQKVNTAKGKFYTARPNTAVVNAVMANHVNDVKGRPQKEDQGYVDSGCSRHMTGNMSYLLDFKQFDERYVIFGGGAKGGRIIVVAGTNSNDFVDGSLFDSSLKNTSNNEPQPSSDAGKKDDDGGIDNQEGPENSSQEVNTVGPSINTGSTNINTGSLNINTVSLLVTTAPLEATHANFFGDETKLDMSNITNTYLVPTTPSTRIQKDHSLYHVIGDVQSGVQTRRMSKTTNEQGFIIIVYEGKTHEDLHTYLFACFLS
ncbi:ribonuclease H-like domain-containing protein [Tanacetum coccineum]